MNIIKNYFFIPYKTVFMLQYGTYRHGPFILTSIVPMLTDFGHASISSTGYQRVSLSVTKPETPPRPQALAPDLHLTDVMISSKPLGSNVLFNPI